MMGRRFLIALTLVTLLVAAGCGRKKPAVVFPSDPIRARSAEAQERFDAAVALLEQGRWAEAVDAFRLVQAQYPGDPIAELSELYAARAELQDISVLEPPGRAVPSGPLSRLAQLGGDTRVDDRIRFGALVYYASGLASMGKGAEALVEMADYPSPQLSPVVLQRDRTGAQALVGEALLRGGRFADAITAFGELHRSSKDEQVRRYAKSRGFEAGSAMTDEALVEAQDSALGFARAIAAWTFLNRRVTKASAEESEALQALLRRFAPDMVEIDEGARIEPLSTALANRGPARKLAIGVVLPLSGRSAAAGRRALEGALVAVDAFAGNLPTTTLVFVDSNTADPSQALARLRSAGVSAVVGPLDQKKAGDWAMAANEQELPIFVLTTEELGAAAGDWAFRWFIDAESEARGVARVAAEQQGDERIAVLYPNIGYGRQMAEWFRAEAEAKGSAIVMFEEYDRTATDYGRLASRVATEAPDAVYIPDTAAKVGEVTAFLAQANVWGLDGTRRPSARAKRIQVHYLGTSLWNDPTLLRQAATYVTGALVPAWSSSAFVEPQSTRFFESYRAQTSRGADDLAAFSYEAISFVRHAFATGAADPLQLRELARTPKAYNGVTGPTRFGPRGEPVRVLRFITVTDSAFAPTGKKTTVGLPDET